MKLSIHFHNPSFTQPDVSQDTNHNKSITLLFIVLNFINLALRLREREREIFLWTIK